nr:SEC-C metal-binding domain-containing protein [Candidatus Sigynarchaeota archaeon]
MNEHKGISPSDFYTTSDEKRNVNWYCYEMALGFESSLGMFLERPAFKKWLQESVIQPMAIDISKKLKQIIIRKQVTNANSLVVTTDLVKQHLPGAPQTIIAKLVTGLNDSIQMQDSCCKTCSTHCLNQQDTSNPMFDDPFYAKPLGNHKDEITVGDEDDAIYPVIHIRKPSSTKGQVPGRKIGRNEPCPCGSGLKYKRCCGSNKPVSMGDGSGAQPGSIRSNPSHREDAGVVPRKSKFPLLELPEMAPSLEKVPKTSLKRCGLCGKAGHLTKTECCGQWICDDEDQYVMFSYARNSCYRNHNRYTLCSFHHVEGHPGKWQDCKQCREAFETEMYVWYGTNQYNFEKLPNPPAFKPIHCAKCNKIIDLGEDGYSMWKGKYFCESCYRIN